MIQSPASDTELPDWSSNTATAEKLYRIWIIKMPWNTHVTVYFRHTFWTGIAGGGGGGAHEVYVVGWFNIVPTVFAKRQNTIYYRYYNGLMSSRHLWW